MVPSGFSCSRTRIDLVASISVVDSNYVFFLDTQDFHEMHKKNETISKKEEEERQYLQSEYEKVKDENSELQVGCFRVHRTS